MVRSRGRCPMTAERAGGGRGPVTNTLVLLRHGQSTNNLEGKFSSWDDDLTEQGRKEATSAARLLRERRFVFDVCFASCLTRVFRTLWIVLDELDVMWVPTRLSWRLNERHYGAPCKAWARKRLHSSTESLYRWRRGYHDRSLALDPSDSRFPGPRRSLHESRSRGATSHGESRRCPGTSPAILGSESDPSWLAARPSSG
jgi:bisphosphoglycerate-dependent phosphoglycerate mutase family 1